MKESEFNLFQPERLKRLSGIEKRPDLFESKLFTVKKTTNPDHSSILSVFRDPGPAAAITPVLKKMELDPNCALQVLCDGRAQETAEDNLSLNDQTSERSALDIVTQIEEPDLIITGASSEPGLEMYISGQFPNKPTVIVEDYYTAANNYLAATKERGYQLPEKICVMDEIAKQIIVERFPEAESHIEITGQPAFDKIVEEDTETIRQRVRSELRIEDKKKIVSFMDTMLSEEETEKIFMQLSQSQLSVFMFAYRKHPRSNIPDQRINQLADNAGLTLLSTENLTTDEVSAASDVVITTWSTAGLEAIYRRKPTIHIEDTKNIRFPKLLKTPLPPSQQRLTEAVPDLSLLNESLDGLLNSDERRQRLITAINKLECMDGKSTDRVLNVINNQLYAKT